MANTYQFASSMNQMEHYQKHVTRFYGGLATQTYGESNSASLAPVACALDVTLAGVKFNTGLTLTLAVSGGLNVTKRNGDLQCFLFGANMNAANLTSSLAEIGSGVTKVNNTLAALAPTITDLRSGAAEVAQSALSIQV